MPRDPRTPHVPRLVAAGETHEASALWAQVLLPCCLRSSSALGCIGERRRMQAVGQLPFLIIIKRVKLLRNRPVHVLENLVLERRKGNRAIRLEKVLALLCVRREARLAHVHEHLQALAELSHGARHAWHAIEAAAFYRNAAKRGLDVSGLRAVR